MSISLGNCSGTQVLGEQFSSETIRLAGKYIKTLSDRRKSLAYKYLKYDFGEALEFFDKFQSSFDKKTKDAFCGLFYDKQWIDALRMDFNYIWLFPDFSDFPQYITPKSVIDDTEENIDTVLGMDSEDDRNMANLVYEIGGSFTQGDIGQDRIIGSKSQSQEYKKFPTLTQERMSELSLRIKKGDIEAKNEFILGNLRLVLFTMNRYYRYTGGHMAEDLIQEGIIGLMKAIDIFDPELGTRFSSIAVIYVRREMQEYYARNFQIMERKTHHVTNLTKFWGCYHSLKSRNNGKIPTIKELEGESGFSEKQIRQFFLGSGNHISFEDPIKGEQTTGDILEGGEKPEDILIGLEEDTGKQRLLGFLNYLDDAKDRDILEMRFGLGEYEEDHTLEEIGTKYKVTKEAIRVKIDNLLRGLHVLAAAGEKYLSQLQEDFQAFILSRNMSKDLGDLALKIEDFTISLGKGGVVLKFNGVLSWGVQELILSKGFLEFLVKKYGYEVYYVQTFRFHIDITDIRFDFRMKNEVASLRSYVPYTNNMTPVKSRVEEIIECGLSPAMKKRLIEGTLPKDLGGGGVKRKKGSRFLKNTALVNR